MDVGLLFPVFFVTLSGYVARQYNYIKEESADALLSYFFKFALPVSCFLIAAHFPQIDTRSNLLHLALSFAMRIGLTVMVVFAVCFFVAKWQGYQKNKAAIIAGMASIPNLEIVGLMILISVFRGDLLIDAWASSLLSLMVIRVLIEPLFVDSPHSYVRHLAQRLVCNLKQPFVIAFILGFIVSGLGWAIPESLQKLFNTVSSSMFAVGLVAVGVKIDLSYITKSTRQVWSIILAKSVLMPLVACGLSWFFAVNPREMAAWFLLCACPSTYFVCQQAVANKFDKVVVQQVFSGTTVVSFIVICLLYTYLGQNSAIL